MGGIVVTGGAGYIGSHIVRELVEAGEERIVVIDDLSSGHAESVPAATLVEGDCGSALVLDEVLGAGDVETVVHMAALCEVGASMTDPAAYYANNLAAGLTLLEAARRHGVKQIVFSSTAAVYGEPERVPIGEDHPQRPTNPYGETKLAFERALVWYHRAYGLRSVALRYFNAAGAHPSGEIGEDHADETHLIPRLLRAAASSDEVVSIFGDDYPTRDGTCVRDYVHVVDLARAHVLAIGALGSGKLGSAAINLGNGEGATVREVIDTISRVVGRRPATRVASRRPGDPATLVASSERARSRLGWRPRYADLDTIVRTAWEWHRRHPGGFAGPAAAR